MAIAHHTLHPRHSIQERSSIGSIANFFFPHFLFSLPASPFIVMIIKTSLALFVVVLAAPAHAFLLMTSCTRMPLRLQPQHHVRMHAHECATRILEPSVTGALEGADRVTRAAAIRSATATLLGCILAPPAFAGTVMVGGEAVGAEEEMDDDAYEVLESSGGPLDFILEKVNLKKLGVGAGALLLADVISGLVMGRSFLKIVSGNADPGKKLATRARAHMLEHAHKSIYT